MLQLHAQTDFLSIPANDITVSQLLSNGKGSAEHSADMALGRGKQGRDGAEKPMEVTSTWPLCPHTQEASQLPACGLLETDTKPWLKPRAGAGQ